MADDRSDIIASVHRGVVSLALTRSDHGTFFVITVLETHAASADYRPDDSHLWPNPLSADIRCSLVPEIRLTLCVENEIRHGFLHRN